MSEFFFFFFLGWWMGRFAEKKLRCARGVIGGDKIKECHGFSRQGMKYL